MKVIIELDLENELDKYKYRAIRQAEGLLSTLQDLEGGYVSESGITSFRDLLKYGVVEFWVEEALRSDKLEGRTRFSIDNVYSVAYYILDKLSDELEDAKRCNGVSTSIGDE